MPEKELLLLVLAVEVSPQKVCPGPFPGEDVFSAVSTVPFLLAWGTWRAFCSLELFPSLAYLGCTSPPCLSFLFLPCCICSLSLRELCPLAPCLSHVPKQLHILEMVALFFFFNFSNMTFRSLSYSTVIPAVPRRCQSPRLGNPAVSFASKRAALGEIASFSSEL